MKTDPTPEEVRASRGALTQAQAADLLGVSLRTWQRYEAPPDANPQCRRQMRRKHLQWFLCEKALAGY